MQTHYSCAQRPLELLNWAVNMSNSILLSDEWDKEKVPVLVYRGMSGISLATALSLELCKSGISCGMVYIRKANEISHGTSVQSNCYPNPEQNELIFVDDFISSGETLEECLREVPKFNRVFAALQMNNNQRFIELPGDGGIREIIPRKLEEIYTLMGK